MNRLEFPTSKLVEPYNPAVKHVICVDERPAVIAGLYRQTGGGVAGIGQSLDITTRVARRVRSEQDASRIVVSRTAGIRAVSTSQARAFPKSYQYSGQAAKTARRAGFELHTHEGCAAELSGQAVAQGMVTRKDEVWDLVQSQQRKDQAERVSKNAFDRIIGAYEDANEAGWVEDPAVSGPLLDSGFELPSGETLPPVDRVALRNMSHIGRFMLLGNVPGVALNVARAVDLVDAETGTPLATYHADVAREDVYELAGALAPAFPVLGRTEGKEIFSQVEYVRNAGLSLFLPQQEGAAPALRSYYDLGDLALTA